MVHDEIVKALIKDARPEFTDPAITFLGDGCDNDNYLIDDRLVLRIPKSKVLGKHLVTEVAFLAKLTDAPLSVPKPTGPLHSRALSWPYCLYPYLPGIQGDVAPHVDMEYAARALGRMIAYLHRFPIREAEAVGLSVDSDTRESSLSLARRRASSIPDIVARLRGDVFKMRQLNPSPIRVVLHDDLWGEHILIEPESGRVSGVIDWADACIGDPARDYGGLLAWMGEDFVIKTLEAGGIEFDEADLSRARFFAMLAGLNSIALGRQMGRPRWVVSGEAALKNSGALVS